MNKKKKIKRLKNRKRNMLRFKEEERLVNLHRGKTVRLKSEELRRSNLVEIGGNSNLDWRVKK